MFDSVLWDYIEEVMSYIGFGDKWRCWIRQSISISRISNLVNGSLKEEFGMERGLRQGDPPPPFPFTVTVEGLSKMLSKGCDLGLGQNGLRILHLQFADDTLISSYDKSASIQNVKRILQRSELVNFFKSTLIGFDPDNEIISDMALSLRCKVESLHSMYLGLPIRASSHYSAMWKPAINRIGRRLTSWKVLESTTIYKDYRSRRIFAACRSTTISHILLEDTFCNLHVYKLLLI